MQRFFSTFPGRWPGADLLLLRSLLGAVAAWQSMSYLAAVAGPESLAPLAAALSMAGGALLLGGVVTPVSSAVAAAGLIIIDASDGAALAGLPLDRVGTACMAIVAISVLLLGPGAFSVDAWWFGRREIVFPDPPPHPRS